MGMFSKAGPTTRSQTAWLDTFIETEKSLRSVSKNLYLHDTPENRDSMSQETNQLFEETYFATDDFNTLKTVTNEEIRSRIIKSLMLAVQIGIDINPVSKEMRDENNKNIGERLALLEKIAKGRDDIQLSDIDLDCSGTTKCIDYFNIKYNELR
jgi:hypothetical protein